MMSVKITRTASGKEKCTGCSRVFERGEPVKGVEYDDGEPAGWFCQSCIQEEKEYRCACGWQGDFEAMDALGSTAWKGCCPVCGNEDLEEIEVEDDEHGRSQ